MINRFISDLKKYSKYIAYATKSQLKTEVTGSYLSWIWLFLNPICFMLIYTFIAIVVFKSKIFPSICIYRYYNLELLPRNSKCSSKPSKSKQRHRY